jgi:hypothetical protein
MPGGEPSTVKSWFRKTQKVEKVQGEAVVGDEQV